MREAIASELANASKMHRLEIRLRGATALGFSVFVCLSVVLVMSVIYSAAMN